MVQDTAVLDFGSGRISVYIGRRGVNNTISISGVGECDYAGFSDGIFFQPDELPRVIGRAISSAQASSRTQIQHLYIGVPGEFTTTVCREANINLGKKKVISDEDVQTLTDSGNSFVDNFRYTLINAQPIYYTLDDERRLIQPVGLRSSRLGGFISYILAEKKFTMMMDKIMESFNIASYDFVSSLLAQTLFLFESTKRDQSVILVDTGFITTDVVVAKGDGILQQFNFPVGGGHISGDLAVTLKIPYAQAEALKRKVILSVDADFNDYYEINVNDVQKRFPQDIVNDIVMARLISIAKTIEKALSQCEYEYPDYIPYHLTGGGISYIKGARDYISKVLNKPIEIIAPSLPQFNRPHLSSSLGLLNMVLDAQPPQRKGFFARLFKK